MTVFLKPGAYARASPFPPPLPHPHLKKRFRSETSKRGKKFRPDMSVQKNARSAQIRQNQNEKGWEKRRKE